MKWLIGFFCCYLAMPALSAFASPQLLNVPVEKLDPETIGTIHQLLDSNWERNSANNAKSQAVFETSPQDNPHVLVAYAINRIQHGKISDALPLAKAVRQRFDTNLDGPVLEIWLLALTDNYESAIVRMSDLKKRIAKANRQRPVSKETEVKIFSRIGRLMGYFEGPVAEKLNPQLVAKISQQLQTDLSPEAQNAFSQNRTSVLIKFKELLNDSANFEKLELARVAAANEIEKQRLEQEDLLVQQTRERLQPKLEQLNETANSESSILEQQIASAANELEFANQSAFRTEQDLAFLYADLLSINRRNRGVFLFDVYALEDQIFRTEVQLNQFRASAINAAANLAVLRNQLIATQTRYTRQIAALQQQLKRSEIIQKRNGRELQKIAQGPKIAGGKKKARKQRRKALRTYDDLSLELYRQELLNAIQ